jgi:hypothetical protein
MPDGPRFGWLPLLFLMLVLAVAGSVRSWYLCVCVENAYGPTPLAVQDAPQPHAAPGAPAPTFRKAPNELDTLAHNIAEDQWFGTVAPLSSGVEYSAHTAPGYPWLLAQVLRATPEPAQALHVVRWAQAFLGAMAAGLYFLFAWRAFGSLTVAVLTGLFCAVHPFWVVNTAEIADGTVTTFLLALALFLGSVAVRPGAAFSSLLFGLSLAALPLTRAALLPFALVALAWFLLRCRTVPRGWLCGLLAVLGLANGLAPWVVRNYLGYHDVLPVSNSAYLHLWAGNNVLATGGPQDEDRMRQALDLAGEDTRQSVLGEHDQTKRYRLLAHDLVNQHRQPWDADRAVRLRFQAGLFFFFGQEWFTKGEFSQADPGAPLPRAIQRYHAVILQGTMLALVLLHILGWRWTYGWRRETRLATLALIWIPLPYILSHAEGLSGPRLPLDGVMLCYAAFAVCCLVPGVGRRLFRGALARQA